MNILVTNDDGIGAKGIAYLVAAAQKFGTVYVVAPKTQQSAVSQGLTIHEPIAIAEEAGVFEGVKAWSVSAKPADCIKVAMEFLKLPIDLVLSGVNDGPNLGTDILYSGTVAACSEACVFRLPSIAFSTDFGKFEIVQAELEKTLGYVLAQKLPDPGVVVNVNFPLAPHSSSKGYRVTKQGERLFAGEYRHDNGRYWSEGRWRTDSVNGPDSDVTAVTEGYTSITPIGINRTAEDFYTRWHRQID